MSFDFADKQDVRDNENCCIAQRYRSFKLADNFLPSFLLGEIPASLGQLVNLVTLDLGSNMLTGKKVHSYFFVFFSSFSSFYDDTADKSKVFDLADCCLP